ncbi:unnamed protein product [Mucor hiemalis]
MPYPRYAMRCRIIDDDGSDKAQLINKVVKSFKVYSNESKLSEATHVRMFTQILDELLMDETSLAFYDGETVSQSTKRMKLMNEDQCEYGRRIDLIDKSREDEEQYDLCSNEFKKANVTIATLNHQHSKNLRINACIMNEINLLFRNYNTRVNRAYASQLPSCDGCSSAHKAGNFTIPKDFIWLGQYYLFWVTLCHWNKSTMDRTLQDRKKNIAFLILVRNHRSS